MWEIKKLEICQVLLITLSMYFSLFEFKLLIAKKKNTVSKNTSFKLILIFIKEFSYP